MRRIIKQEPYEYGVPERFDTLNKTEGGTKWAVYERNGWIIETWPKFKNGEGVQKDFAPASDFYMIIKYYHPNGMLKSRVKYTCGITFGKKEFFDEQGNLIKLEDRDSVFAGIQIRREEVLDILQKVGVFNLKTGKHFSIDEFTSRKDEFINPLKTDGSFYRLLQNRMSFKFNPAEMKDGKEINPPMWIVETSSYKNNAEYTDVYQINAHTGQFTVKTIVQPLQPAIEIWPDK